ncbi:carboxylesterase/lipase family protein [Lelliottia nimipressuralis]
MLSLCRILTFVLPAVSVGGLAAPMPLESEPVVTVTGGQIRGITDGTIQTFKGIPYASPPVEELRWRAPQPVKTWSGVRDASRFGKSCMQTDDLPQSEDCLTLNVWTPSLKPDRPLPVMVWIYGGALVHGNTPLYTLDRIAQQGVVAVSMNYRMGRLGFFLHPALEKETPNEAHGNYGYLDQLAALKWVLENIQQFGGDPRQITLFGESAGGGSVLSHLSSPMSRGLFQRAILQSPGIPTGRAKVLPLTPAATARDIAVRYARSLGIDTDGEAALKALRALPAEKLTEGASAQDVLKGLSDGKLPLGIAGAIVDGTFLSQTPEAVFTKSQQAKVPILLGANSRDLSLGAASSKNELFSLFKDDRIEAIKRFDPTGIQTLSELKQDVFADKTLVEPTRHLATLAEKTGEPVYLYRFSYVAEDLRSKQKGALHGLEIPYTLNIPRALVKDKVTGDDIDMAHIASAYWVNFARTGDPNAPGLLLWPRYSPSEDVLMNFTQDGVIVGSDPEKARLDIVEKLYSED